MAGEDRRRISTYEALVEKYIDQVVDKPSQISKHCKIKLKCFKCGIVCETTPRNLSRARLDKFHCPSCRSVLSYKKGREKHERRLNDSSFRAKHLELCRSEEHREKISKSSKWDDPAYREKQVKVHKDSGYLTKLSSVAVKAFGDPDYKQKHADAISTVEAKMKLSVANKKKWENDEYREKISSLTRQRNKKNWSCNDFRNKITQLMNSTEYKELLSLKSKEAWNNPNYRSRIISYLNSEEFSFLIKKLWGDPVFANRMAELRLKQPRVSSIQTVLYSMLDDLGVKYFREYPDRPADPEVRIGPYTFDCVIPREGKPSLLIECQGDYWHSLEKAVRLDKQKASYISNNFRGQYELKYLWEHEFDCKERVVDSLKYWLGIVSLDVVDYDFGDVVIRPSPASDYRLLLSKYHYLANAGRGGVAIGAYHQDVLIAVSVFSPPIRQNVDLKGFDVSQVRELSRLCIHPRYRKKNLGSWFISRAVEQLDNVKMIISYCDSTFNHDGTVYKASNFILDGTVPADYWYVDLSGWVMHKKSLYNRAVKNKLGEADYASRHGYKKVFGCEKLRFVRMIGIGRGR